MGKNQTTPAPRERVVVQEKIEHKNIYAALSAFQGELKAMAKTGHVEFPTKTGGVMKFDYTPLGEIMTTIYPMLGKHGLSVRHEVTKEGVEAILTHETYEEGEVKEYEVGTTDTAGAKVEKKFVTKSMNQIRSGVVKIGQAGEMKDTGAAITYARRYTLTMLLGISSEEDKDAEFLEQSAKNAIQTVYDRFKAGVEQAKTIAAVEKTMTVLKKDLKMIEDGKAPSLGLSKEQTEELITVGEMKVQLLEDSAGKGEEEGTGKLPV